MAANDEVPELSLVIPAYNEIEALPHCIDQLHWQCKEITNIYEIIIINDGSSDRTEEYLVDVSVADSHVIPITFSRNFGKEAALAAGLAAARGKCIAFLDADLQHPPHYLKEMYEKWRNGADIVNAVKRRRHNDPFLYRKFAGLFNWLMSTSTGGDMAEASDYKLIDRQVADVLLSFPERNRFFRGLVAWVGFNVATVEFDVGERRFGSSKWGIVSLITYSIRNIVAFSSWPLRAVGVAGFITVGLGMLLLIQTLIRFFFGVAASGFTTVISVQIVLSGMILLALGIIAIYLSKMYDEQKRRPIFIVRKPSTRSGCRDIAKVEDR